jgi:hypothetical protein
MLYIISVVSDVCIISNGIELGDANPLITPPVMGETLNAALPSIVPCLASSVSLHSGTSFLWRSFLPLSPW